MGRKSRVGGVHHGPVADRSEHTRRGTQMTVTTKHMLLTGSWKTDVEASETAIGRFTADRPLTNDCQVVFFEIASDGHLHVNVTHKYQTMAVKGWAGPASLPGGFVTNRILRHPPPSRIVRPIRDMVFAARL